jgi:mannose-1-phosphate guanylyltransferase
MKAMILAAGMGERLRPLTNIYPKVLVPVVNMPVIDRIIQFLTIHGVKKIIINAHHHAQMICDYLQGGTPFGVKVETRIEKEILGTGGGIKNTENFWGIDPFIVINGDILTDIDLGDVYGFHMKKNHLVTMVLHDFPQYNKVRVDKEMNILSIGPGTDLKGTLAFTGIHIINPEVLRFIPDKKKYNIIDVYKRLIDLKKPIKGYVATGHRWIDIGTIPDYLQANFYYLPQGNTAIDQNCSIDSSATLKDWAVIGKSSSIERSTLVQRSVLWNDVIIKDGVRVVDSVITSSVVVKKDLIGGVAIR